MLRKILACVLLLLAAPAILAAPLEPPCPYTVESEDKKQIFVMLTAPVEGECGARSPSEAEARKALRTKYRQSGLYENGDPEKLRWTIDEDWSYPNVFVANDGVHVVLIATFGRDSSAEAFRIHQNGKMLRKYTIGELVRDKSALRFMHSTVLWSKNMSLNDRTSRFNLETVDGIKYEIDLSTGEIADESPIANADRPGGNGERPDEAAPKRSCLGLAFVTGLAMFAAGYTVVRRRTDMI